MEKYTLDQCSEILKEFNISDIQSMKLIESSHGEEDVRYNYVIDKKYVFRVNSAQVFSEERFYELNDLVRRYHEYGIKAPLFLQDKNGIILHKKEDCYYYVSEYLDGIIPPQNLLDVDRKILINERLKLIAEFASKYKNVGLSSVMSMYSLFDLCPYDQITGIDEKQENLESLVKALQECEKRDIADKLVLVNGKVREELFCVYQSLPRCVFQGDENWQNVIVDEKNHIMGLFDFNMAGTEVIVNYFANTALLEPSYINDAFHQYSAKELYKMTLEKFRENTEIIKKYYEFSVEEERAYHLYAKIVLLSSWPNTCTFLQALENKKEKNKVIELLELLMDYEK